MPNDTSVDRAALPIVLLVFDCPTTQSFLELALVDDAAVVTTRDPDVALRLLDRVDVAAIVVDPDLAGSAAGLFLAELRREAVGATILALEPTDGSAPSGDAIPKPVDRGRLLASLLRVLEGRATTLPAGLAMGAA